MAKAMSGRVRVAYFKAPTMLLYSVGLCKGAPFVCEIDRPEHPGVGVGLESSKCVRSSISWIYFN